MIYGMDFPVFKYCSKCDGRVEHSYIDVNGSTEHGMKKGSFGFDHIQLDICLGCGTVTANKELLSLLQDQLAESVQEEARFTANSIQ